MIIGILSGVGVEETNKQIDDEKIKGPFQKSVYERTVGECKKLG